MTATLLTDVFAPDRLLEHAAERAGLVLTEDPEIIEPLQRILSELGRGSARLSAQGTQVMEAYLIDSLVLRMKLRDRLARHPDILDQPIARPVFITGLPRTGSTKLQRMLAASGAFQSIPLWKILNPLPLDPEDANDTPHRIAIAEQTVAQIRQAYPRFYAGHPMIATEPDEESLFLEVAFKADPIGWRAHVPEYMAWLSQQDIGSTYRWLKSVLQLLQWQDEPRDAPRPWVLKAPSHLGRIDELFTVFPDATLVQCHRDPCVALPSAAALAKEMHGFYSDDFDEHAAGRFVMSHLSEDMARCLRARKHWAQAGKTIIDLPFERIVKQPHAVCDAVFGTLGMGYDATAQAGVARWEAANPAFLHGRFDYSPQRCGLRVDEIRDAFAEYIHAFAPDA